MVFYKARKLYSCDDEKEYAKKSESELGMVEAQDEAFAEGRFGAN